MRKQWTLIIWDEVSVPDNCLKMLSNGSRKRAVFDNILYKYIYCGVCLLATRILSRKSMLIGEVANWGTELIQNLYIGHENWLLIG